jgi:hypothetical protein
MNNATGKWHPVSELPPPLTENHLESADILLYLKNSNMPLGWYNFEQKLYHIHFGGRSAQDYQDQILYWAELVPPKEAE